MDEDINKAIEIMKAGGIILYPTDTIWGIGCDATNAAAVQKIYNLKQRIESKSMIVLTDSEIKISRYVKDVPDIAYDLIDMTDTPLTIIYDNACYLATNIIAEDGSIAIRVTKEEFSKKLCRLFKNPIVSTSANISGQQTPKNFDEISDEIKAGVDYIVKYGQANVANSKSSSIIKLKTNGEIKIIRN